jgi:hypothetical protein
MRRIRQSFLGERVLPGTGGVWGMKFVESLQLLRVALGVRGSIDGCAYGVDVILASFRAGLIRVSPGQVIFVAGSIPGSSTEENTLPLRRQTGRNTMFGGGAGAGPGRYCAVS